MNTEPTIFLPLLLQIESLWIETHLRPRTKRRKVSPDMGCDALNFSPSPRIWASLADGTFGRLDTATSVWNGVSVALTESWNRQSYAFEVFIILGSCLNVPPFAGSKIIDSDRCFGGKRVAGSPHLLAKGLNLVPWKPSDASRPILWVVAMVILFQRLQRKISYPRLLAFSFACL